MDDLLHRLRPPAGRQQPRQFAGPQTGTVLGTAGDGRLRVELDALRGAEHLCRWSAPDVHSHPAGVASNTAVTPPAGTRCLVLFSDRGIADGWVVQFDRWPA